MFTQGFVSATSPWVGTSSAQSSVEGMGTAGTTLFLTESAIFVDRFVPTQQCLPLSFASGGQQILSLAFLLLHVHSLLYSRCAGVCICTTCALRQTPHGDMCRGVLGSVCNALTLYVYFASGKPFLFGVLRVQASTAVQPVRSTHVHFSSPLTHHYPALCLYRPPNASIPMHTFASLKHESRTYSSTTSRLVVHAQLPT